MEGKPKIEPKIIRDAERIIYEEKVVRLKREIAELDAEILRLELEKKNKETNEKVAIPEPEPQKTPETIQKPPSQLSRRRFLGMLGLGAVGVGAAIVINKLGKKDTQIPEIPPKKEPEPEITPEKPIEEGEFKKYEKIIKNEQFEKILKNPLIVSALYYSEGAIDKMTPPNENRNEEMIWKIHQLFTKDFRKKYIKYLNSVIEEKSPDMRNTVPKPKATPLATISFGKDLENGHPNAVDLFIKEGSTICSMSGGIVVLSENTWTKDNERSTSSNRGGNTVIIFNPNNESFYRYAHLKETLVETGTILSSGQEIGTVGHTGLNANKKGHGQHLHLEIHRYDREQGVMIPEGISDLIKELKKIHH